MGVDVEVLKSYLVDLGFAVNEPQLRKFDNALRQAAGLVESATSGIASQVIKWQVAITTAFTGVATGTLALADHVAQADQQYRLFGLRMMMSTDQARKLKIGMDALGASMEEIAWDPELRKRFLELNQLQDGLASKFGGNFEANMRGIRDMRFEITKLQVEFQYLSMVAISALYEKLKPYIEIAMRKAEQFVTYLVDHLPEISDYVANNLVPVLKTTWDILKGTGEAVGTLITVFTNLVGLLSGDQSIQGTEFNFRKFAGAIQHVVEWVGKLMHTLLDAEKVLAHFANAAVLVLSGRFSDAKKELGAALSSLGPGAGAILGGVGGSMAGGAGAALYGAALGAPAGPLGMLAGAVTMGTLGAVTTGVAGAGLGAGVGWLNKHSGGTDSADLGHIRDLAIKAGQELGINPRLIFEQWQHESGNFKSHVMQTMNNMGGIRLPGSTQYQHFDTLDDYAKRYVEVLRLKRYKGIENAQTEEQFAAALKRGGYFEDTYDNYANALKRFKKQDASLFQPAAAAGSNTTIEIGDVHVHVAETNASADEIGDKVHDRMQTLLAKQRQRNLAQLSYVGG